MNDNTHRHRPKIVQQALLGRVSQAATAAERLAAELAHDGYGLDRDALGEDIGHTDRISMAYLYRLFDAVERIQESTEHDCRVIEPHPRYLGRLRDKLDMGYTASRNPDPS